ncbi:methyltransferase type 11 [Shewanella mangrovi]|uniref:Methyltransferase type 11 n=1 Tax=Shewanella mangrovi TaxID=1515746 RepID=A0A094JFM9_9GAMM|nr:class I SAM-dependent methyltransferase [Shewanella mangrovi]KFZ38755.1 methyltransferase type 11 [Shewanella mangrovi]
MRTPRELQALYHQGENISQTLRSDLGLQHNTKEIIEIAYDLQTGSYVRAMGNAEWKARRTAFSTELANTILKLCNPQSILEAGVGEATTLSGVLQHLGADIDSYGFDLSWSRAAYAKRWLDSQAIHSTTICTGDLLNMPFADNSIDVVYTAHSVEPNGGKEKQILEELYRVAGRFLILLEPGYELASAEAQQRMDSHGYCKNLKGIAEQLGYRVLKHALFPLAANSLNPTAITIIEKQTDFIPPTHVLACPQFKTPLEDIEGMLFSPEALTVYPIVGNIPCLRIDNGIFASKYTEVMGKD